MANAWYAFYPGDYARDTAHLSLAEDGAYRRLLDHYYSSGRPIPAHDEQLFRICRAFNPFEQKAVSDVVEQFFTRDGDVLHHGRVDRELAKQSKYKAKLSEGAQITNRKRWGQSPSESLAESPSDRKPQPQSHTEPKSKACARPSFEEVAQYCRERGNIVDPRRWFDHYTSNGWKVGKNPMKDWRAAVRTWESNGVNASLPNGRPDDSAFVGQPADFGICPLGECDGSGWWVDSRSRKRVDCKCKCRERPITPVPPVDGPGLSDQPLRKPALRTQYHGPTIESALTGN